MTDLQCPVRVMLARHGEAEYERSTLSDDGGSLTQLGRRQAADLAQGLAHENVSHVWSSSRARAVQTAEIAAAILGVGVTVREGLCEFGVGEYAGLPADPDPFGDLFASWQAGVLDARVPGAESGRDVVNRMGGVLSEIADRHRGEAVLVVSHGGAMGLTLQHLVGLPAMAQLPNCRVVEVQGDSSGWSAAHAEES